MTEQSGIGRNGLYHIAAALMIMLSADVYADGVRSAPVTVKVTIMSEPCVINDGNPVDVDFGNDLLTTEVDGNHYVKTVNYTLDCSSATRSALKMKITGTAAEFDSGVLQVAEQANMGIKLLSGGAALPLNSWLNFTTTSPPVLQAVPVKAPGGTLNAGAFSAAATMTVDYQ